MNLVHIQSPRRDASAARKSGFVLRLSNILLVSAVLLAGAISAQAQGIAPTAYSLTSFATYTEDFDTLATANGPGNTGTALPAGWGFAEEGTSGNGTYGIDTGSSVTGNTYSYGDVGTSERAFGMLRGAAVVSTIGAAFTNNTGQTISTFTITYAGEQWRTGDAHAVKDRLDFQFSTTANSLTGTGAVGYTDVDALDFASIYNGGQMAQDGNQFQSVKTATFTANLAPGKTMFIRYNDVDVNNADDGLAVDNFNMTYQPVPAPPAAISLGIGGVVGLLGTGVTRARRRKKK